MPICYAGRVLLTISYNYKSSTAVLFLFPPQVIYIYSTGLFIRQYPLYVVIEIN